MFNSFRKGNTNEYTKIYKTTMYNKEHLKDMYFGDYFKEELNNTKSVKK